MPKGLQGLCVHKRTLLTLTFCLKKHLGDVDLWIRGTPRVFGGITPLEMIEKNPTLYRFWLTEMFDYASAGKTIPEEWIK